MDTKTRAAIIGVCITALFAMVGIGWGLANDRSNAMGRITATQLAVADHEQRLRTIEDIQATLAADVRWIRQTMEQERQ